MSQSSTKKNKALFSKIEKNNNSNVGQEFTKKQVVAIAKLANLPVKNSEQPKLVAAFAETLGVINQLGELDVSQTVSTHQVTGLENVWREDLVNPARTTLSQEEALANAQRTHKGYIVVSRVIKN